MGRNTLGYFRTQKKSRGWLEPKDVFGFWGENNDNNCQRLPFFKSSTEMPAAGSNLFWYVSIRSILHGSYEYENLSGIGIPGAFRLYCSQNMSSGWIMTRDRP